jgi:prophage maintenance system killer protein
MKIEKTNKKDVDSFLKVIKKIHKMATNYNPETNIRDLASLEFIIYKSFNNKIKTPIDFAAHFVYYIPTRQVFSDGNKRTAVSLAISILKTEYKEFKKPVKGINWENKENQIVKFMIDIVDRKYTLKQVKVKLREIFLKF